MALSDVSGTHITLGGVEATEVAGSARITVGRNKTRGVRVFMCSWTDRFRLSGGILGEYTRAPGGAFITYKDPAKFPDYESLVAVDAAISGEGAMSQSGTEVAYSLARVTIGYEPRSYGIAAETAADEEARVVSTLQIDWQGEFLQLPEKSFVWDGGGNDGEFIKESPGMIITTLERSYTRRDLDAVPETAISNAQNKVNSGEFQGIAAGKLLFAGAASEEEFKSDGTRSVMCRFFFKQRYVEWNKLWNPAEGAWRDVKGDVSDDPMYEDAAFTGLLSG